MFRLVRELDGRWRFTYFSPGLLPLFGLTPAEGDVAAMIGQGFDVPEIAAQRLATESTIRAQMKAIFRKMDVNRQVDLVQILARLRA